MYLFQIINVIINCAFLILIAVFMVYGIRAMTVYIENNKKGGSSAGGEFLADESGHKEA
ncbi:MAG: hypothetical protein Q4G07_11450 [Oscillospiraceae bacterium]|nr:hypothetical protein [Oscillospiraceae bacterium]